MVKTVERAHAIGATALAVFADNPTAWRRRAEPSPELPAFRQRLRDLDITPLTIHASYLVNLAGPEPDFFERSIEVLASELNAAPAFGAAFVNTHIGSHRGSGISIGSSRLAEGLDRALAEMSDVPDAAAVLLENSSGAGFGLGTNLDELAGIAEAVDARGIPAHRVGFCLDTAHAWGAGVDVGDPDAIDAFLTRFDALIGLHRLLLIHLNDSRSELGSRSDRHEHLGAGRIGERGLGHLIRHPSLAHVAWILETPGMDEGYDAVNVARAWDLVADRPLAPLPPEAFRVRAASKSRIAAPDMPEVPVESLER